MNIDLGASAHDGRHSGCLTMANELYTKLSNGYTHEVSAAPLTEALMGKTAQRRARRAANRGYYFTAIDPSAWEDDIFDINTSAERRQGRPMAPGYLERPHYGALELPHCNRHHVYRYGVVGPPGYLAAYLWLYRCGDLALVSTILGHAQHLKDDIMYALVMGAVEEQYDLGGVLVYNLHTSGTDGLRYFKEKLGLHPTEVTWHV